MEKTEKIISEFERFVQEYNRDVGCTSYDSEVLEGALALLKAQEPVEPAADVAPVVHARWRELKDGTEECTNCLGLCPHEENYNGDVIFNFGCEYCPWCGAKMDKEGE